MARSPPPGTRCEGDLMTNSGVPGRGSARGEPLTPGGEHLLRRCEHLRHDLRDICVRRTMVDEAGTQREAAADRRVRKIHAPALDDTPEDRCVGPISIHGGSLWPITEAHGTQAHGREKLERLGCSDLLRKALGVQQVRANRAAEGRQAVIAHRQP